MSFSCLLSHFRTNPNLWYHWQTTRQDKAALQGTQRTSWYSQTFKWTVKGLYRTLKEPLGTTKHSSEQSKDFTGHSKNLLVQPNIQVNSQRTL